MKAYSRLIGGLRGQLVLLALASAWVVFTPPTASAQDVAIIALDMDPAAAGVQSVVSLPEGGVDMPIDVVVQGANAIGAFEFWLTFNPLYVTYQGWTLGPFLESTGRVATCQELRTETTVRIGCSTAGPPPPEGPSGDGVLGTLLFKSRFPGPTCITLILVETAEVFGDQLPTVEQSGCLTVVPRTPTPTPPPTLTPVTTATGTATRTATITPTTSTATPTGTATPQPFICPLSHGSWKTHPESWPVDSLVLGDETYSAADLLTILGWPGSADASVILAHQLIAAKLNLANQADPLDIVVIVALADQLLAPLPGRLAYNISPSSAEGNPMMWVAASLDAYNTSCTGSGQPGTPGGGGTPSPVVTVLGSAPPVRPRALPNVGDQHLNASSGGYGGRAWAALFIAGALGLGLAVAADRHLRAGAQRQ